MSMSSVVRMLIFTMLGGGLVTGCSSVIKQLPFGKHRSAQITVPGDRAWTPTGIVVKEKDRIQISASGTISNNAADTGRDPDGKAGLTGGYYKRNWNPLPGANDLSLIGRIGDVLFAVGSQMELQAEDDGEVFLGVNDNNFSDNAGAWKVSLRTGSRRADLPAKMTGPETGSGGQTPLCGAGK